MGSTAQSSRGLVLGAATFLATAIAIAFSYVFYVRSIKKPWVPLPLSLVLSEECADVFLLQLDILNKECLKKTISKGLGYAIVMAAAGLKLPVINNVVKAKSALGMSSSSVLLESVALTCGFASAIKKGNVFSLWGELLLIFLQNIGLLLLARHYSNGADPSILMVLAVVLWAVGATMLPIEADILLAFSTVIAIASRVPQISANFQQKHTGVLSLITQSLQVLGGLARLGTVAVETGDRMQIASYAVALSLNVLLLIQVILYWSNTKKQMADKMGKKKE